MYPDTLSYRAKAFGRLVLLLVAVSVTAAAPGQETQDEAPLVPLTEQESALLDQLLEKIESDRIVAAALADRLATQEEFFKSIIHARLDRVTGELFNGVLDLARRTIELESEGKDAQKYRQLIEKDLKQLPETAFSALDRINSRVNYPSEKMTTVELVEADQRLFSVVSIVDYTYQLLFDYLAIAEEMQFAVDEVREKIGDNIVDSAASRSVFLDMAIATAKNLRASAAILPENADIAGKLRAADARVTHTAAALQNTVGFLRLLDFEDRQYRQQILTATGQITTDVFDVGIVADLIAGWSATLLDLLTDQGPKLLLKLFLMTLIVYLAIRLSRLVEMGINRGLDSLRVQISNLLRRMIVSSVRNLVVLLGLLIALSQLGISLGPLLAGLGIAGFIIGFAMQDALSNFASGMLILFYRPFDVGDTVEAGGVGGKVRSMSLVNTTIMTFDNRALVVPNNLIWSTVITNVTAQRTRRVDLSFGISYSDDIEKTILRKRSEFFAKSLPGTKKCWTLPNR